MRVLLFEQWHGGHYFNYLECLVPRLAALCTELIVAVTDVAYRSPRFEQQVGRFRALQNVHFDHRVPLPHAAAAVRYRLSLGRHLVEAIDRHAPDYVFLPSGDEQSLPLPLLMAPRTRRVPIEAVLHYKAYTGDGTLGGKLTSALERALLLTGTFSCLNFVNFLQYEDAVRHRRELVRFARVAGDPVPKPSRLDRQQARADLGLETSGRLLGMIGALDKRKAVVETLAAFRRARLRRDDRLLLAGKLDSTYAECIDQEFRDLVDAGRLYVLDRFLSDEDLSRCYAAVDLNCSVYSDFYGLSSLMLRSIAADVPVITGRLGWSGAIVRRFDVGHSVDPKDTTAYAALLSSALEQSGSYMRSSAVDRLLKFHSVENFVGGVVERLGKKSGSASTHQIRDWAWVMEGVDPERRSLR